MSIICILISLVINLDWPLLQYDIQIAFLHGDLDEEIYMKIPHGYDESVISGNTDIGEDREEKTDRIGSVISIEKSVTFTFMYNAFYRLKKNMTIGVQWS